MDINVEAKRAHSIAESRMQDTDWNGSVKHLMGECVELVTELDFDRKISELGDVLVCCLSICAAHNIDVEELIKKTQKKNEDRII